MNSKNGKTSDPHGLLINLADKINLKSHARTMNLKYHLQRGMKSLNYLIDHIMYQIFKGIVSIY